MGNNVPISVEELHTEMGELLIDLERLRGRFSIQTRDQASLNGHHMIIYFVIPTFCFMECKYDIVSFLCTNLIVAAQSASV